MQEVGNTVRTTCPYCGVGCGVLATVQGDGQVSIKGDAEHSANFGRLCSKGSALGETLSLDDRLLAPVIDGRDASWDEALSLVAGRFAETASAHGPDATAFYVSGQLLTEDYYVANKLMKGFIGTANIDTNSRLCMASSVAGHRRAFGSDTVPGIYEDLEQADLVVLVGSNLAWCHPVLFQRLQIARRRRGSKLVVIDPRRSASAEDADLHLAVAPGSDVALFVGLLEHLAAAGHTDSRYVSQHTSGIDEALAAAFAVGLSGAARETGLPAADLRAFYELFARHERVVTVYSQGVNQATAGTDKVNAIINCHLLTGRIGRPGMGPFSVTGQPNAMGGREVGGLANMLAAHMDLENPEHRQAVQAFWDSPRMATKPGLKAVDLFRAVRSGEIKALWIMATNPVDSLPEADLVAEALEVCPFVVVSDVTRDTDTAQYADVLLPAAAWGEKSGTVTNSERTISRQRSFLPRSGEARPDWWIVCEVARRMGFTGFDYDEPAAIFREYAELTGLANNGRRDLDLTGLAELDGTSYDGLAPLRWPVPAGYAVGGEKRFFAAGGFFTSDRRARFVATPVRRPVGELCEDRPFVLNSGRIRDQWHTMTRTAKSARLMSHLAEPFVEIHPDDAAMAGLAPAGLSLVETDHGSAVLRILTTERQRRRSLFVPMHWTGQTASRARVGALFAGNTDPVSGQPALKFTPAAIRPFDASWYGFLVAAERPDVETADYWALARAAGGWRAELAGLSEPADWSELVARLIGADGGAGDFLDYADAGQALRRFAVFRDDRLVGAFFAGREPVAVSRPWAVAQLTARHTSATRLGLLAGRGGADLPDPGSTICSCFAVGSNQIARAAACGATTVDAIGVQTGAGTNCGSCRAEIQRLIDANALKEAV